MSNECTSISLIKYHCRKRVELQHSLSLVYLLTLLIVVQLKYIWRARVCVCVCEGVCDLLNHLIVAVSVSEVSWVYLVEKAAP